MLTTRMRRWIPARSMMATSLLFVAIGCCPVTTTTNQSDGPSQVVSAVGAEKTYRALDAELESVVFQGVTLDEAVADLSQLGGVDAYVDWDSLTAEGIDRDTPVHVRLRDVSLEKALQVTLDTVSPSDASVSYVVDNAGMIVVTTERNIAENFADTRRYDVRDIVPASSEACFGPPDAPKIPDRASRAELVEEVIKLVRETVDPDSWVTEGGALGEIREQAGFLDIKQTPDNHRQIADLLRQLRDARRD